jgi:hypothetical protein
VKEIVREKYGKLRYGSGGGIDVLLSAHAVAVARPCEIGQGSGCAG